MKQRFSTGMLALFLGTFGAQKFYLGRKKEGILCLLLIWTGIPTFLGIFEGLWIFSRTTEQWENYLKALTNPKGYTEPALVKLYIYPVALFAFFFSLYQIEHPVFRFSGLLLLVAIWLYPGANEEILMNRFMRIKQYPYRIGSTVIIGFILSACISVSGVQPPNVELVSPEHVTQTGGTYEAKFYIRRATKVQIDGKEIPESQGRGEYTASIELKERTTKIRVHAENRGKITDQDAYVTRGPNDAELAVINEQKKQAELAQLAIERAKAEEIKKQQEAEAKCQKDLKCRKQREDEDKERELAQRDEQLRSWLSSNKSTAFSTCKIMTKDRLKAPSTADFPWDAQWTAIAKGGYIYAGSYVDAQNGFGAQIRSQFICRFELQGNELLLSDISIF